MKKAICLAFLTVFLLSSCREEPEIALLNSLSMREKVAQLLVAHHYDPEIDSLVARDGIGGVIVMVSNKAEVDTLMPRLHAESKIPLLTCMDAEWGVQMRLRKDFKRQKYACEIKTAAEAYETGLAIGRELDSICIKFNLAPDADVNTNPKNPVIGFRSFGDNPQMVSDLANAYARGLHDAGIGACAKHFPGHGDTGTDSHKALPVLNHSRERLDSVELVPFRRLIAEDIDMVMMGHLSVPALDPSGLPSSISKPIYDFLRDSLNYKGVIITDGLVMKGLVNMFGGDDVAASVAAYEAGADLLLGANHVKDIIDAITAKVESGEFPVEELDTKVLRVLKLKKKYNIING